MGVGGSGMSATAGVAHKFGYDIDGCDIDISSQYIGKLKTEIKIVEGHSAAHVKDKDILVVSPAIYYKYPPELEIKTGKNTMTWQQFLGQYLQADKEVIAVSGTHGKSTTTAILALVFQKAKYDPNCVVGATLKEWGANYRVGEGKVFITEADEFYNNFLNYSPEAIILNNVELDHPDFFKTNIELYASFKKHILSLKGKSILVANIDSDGVQRSLAKLGALKSRLNIYTYSLKRHGADFRAVITERSPFETRFVVNYKDGHKEEFVTNLAGDHNISNILGVIALSSLYSIKPDDVRQVLRSFNGIGKRMELIGIKRGVFVYDDYAHHPTAVKVTLQALKQKHPLARLYAVIEPHSYSRVKKFLKGFMKSFDDAYTVAIAPIFQARDKEDFGMSIETMARVIPHERIWAADSFEKIAEMLSKELRKKDVVIVMGAGKSSDLAKLILKVL